MYPRFKVLAILSLLGVSCFSASAQSIHPPKGFEGKLAKATFSLYGHLPGSSVEHFVCTATAYEKIKGGYNLISAGHCIQDSPASAVFEVAETMGGPLTPVRVVNYRDEGKMDFAVLELKTTKKYPVIPLGPDSIANVGDKIVDMNFSEGVAKQVSEGIISSPIMSKPDKCESCPGRYMVQIFGGPGSSGSAVVLKKNHKIIGILRGGFDSNIGAIITPVSGFADFLKLPAPSRAQTVVPETPNPQD